MFTQSFPVTGRKPRVILDHIEGNLTVRSWNRREIRVEADEPIAELRQEGDIVIITNYRSDIRLWVPAMREFLTFLATSIAVSHLNGNATLEGAGNIEMREVNGAVVADRTHGNIDLADLHEAAQLTEIGGNLRAMNAPFLRARGGVGGNVDLLQIGDAAIDNVGGNLDARDIRENLQCSSVGGNSRVTGSAGARIGIQSVGGNAVIDTAASILSCSAGGNLQIAGNFAAGSSTHLSAGGNASVIFPENADVRVRAIAGGIISSPSAPMRISGLVALVYGEGRATLEITAGGNVSLQGYAVPQRA